jgi:PadR family transcriptional regulator AphA
MSTPMARTATTSNAILGLLALRPSWPAYELTQQLRRNMRFFWPRAESRIYAEMRVLESKGLVRSTRVSYGGRMRSVYRITPAGKRHVVAWLATAPRETALECEPILRLLLGDLGTPEALIAAVQRIRADAEAVLEVGRVVSREYLAGTAPFQDDVHLRAFVFDFLSSHALAMLQWAERTETSLASWSQADDETRAAAALAIIGARLGEYPKDRRPPG